MFALANGHIGLRGNLDEGEPNGLPGSYLNGFYEARPLPYAEAGYGYPEAGADGGQRDQRQDHPAACRRRALRRPLRRAAAATSGRSTFGPACFAARVEWRSPAGRAVRVSSVRLVSFVQRAVAAILYEVEPLDERSTARRAVGAGRQRADARRRPTIRAQPRALACRRSDPSSSPAATRKVVLVHSTEVSGLRLAAAMDHIVDGPPGTEANPAESGEDLGRVTVTADVEPGQRLRLVKFLAYGWSSQRSTAALRDQVAAALAEARHTGWEGLLAGQRALPRRLLGPRRRRAGGRRRAPAGGALRALPHAAGRRPRRAARDRREGPDRPRLQRPRLLGHRDVRPAARSPTRSPTPRATRCAGGTRRSTWRASARSSSGWQGRRFPWRTIAGQECSGYWPAGTAAFHVNADIADAVGRYQAATGDEAFEREAGSSCSSRQLGCGGRSAITTRPDGSGSTA